MATKKQKRQALLQKREKFEANLKRSNQEALRKERERREEENRRAWQENHDKRHSWKKRIKECPLCKDALKGAVLSPDSVLQTFDDSINLARKN